MPSKNGRGLWFGAFLLISCGSVTLAACIPSGNSPPLTTADLAARCPAPPLPADFNRSGTAFPAGLRGKQIIYVYQAQNHHIGSQMKITTAGTELYYFQDVGSGSDVAAVAGPTTESAPEGEIFPLNRPMDFLQEPSRANPKWHRLFQVSHYRGIASYQGNTLSVRLLFGGVHRQTGRCADVTSRLDITFGPGSANCTVAAASIETRARSGSGSIVQSTNSIECGVR